MSHPLLIVNGSEWAKMLKIFKETVSWLALHQENNEEEVTKLVEQYFKEIDSNQPEIFEATCGDIVRYLNFYNVAPKEGLYDEFKGIYFTGIVVSRFLVRDGLADLNKLHLKAMLRMLDFRLDEPHKARRKLLTDRIISIIDNNALEDHLGKYGWYLIYKCLFNAVDERSKTL